MATKKKDENCALPKQKANIERFTAVGRMHHVSILWLVCFWLFCICRQKVLLLLLPPPESIGRNKDWTQNTEQQQQRRRKNMQTNRPRVLCRIIFTCFDFVCLFSPRSRSLSSVRVFILLIFEKRNWIVRARSRSKIFRLNSCDYSFVETMVIVYIPEPIYRRNTIRNILWALSGYRRLSSGRERKMTNDPNDRERQRERMEINLCHRWCWLLLLVSTFRAHYTRQ